MENHNEELLYMKNNADIICAEISSLLKSQQPISETKANELIKLGLEISMMCDNLIDE